MTIYRKPSFLFVAFALQVLSIAPTIWFFRNSLFFLHPQVDVVFFVVVTLNALTSILLAVAILMDNKRKSIRLPIYWWLIQSFVTLAALPY